MLTNVRQWFEQAGQGPWIAWGGMALGLISFLFAFYFYLKSRRLKQPYCLTSSSTIVSDALSAIQELNITYRGRPVESLTITTLVFWNAGREPINGSDIPSNSPCRILVAKGAQILDIKTRFAKNAANRLSCSVAADGSHALIDFEYLGKDDGVVLEIVHTGQSDGDIQLDGVFKGAEKLVRRRTIAFHRWPSPFSGLLTSDTRVPLAVAILIGPIVLLLDRHLGLLGGYSRYTDLDPWVISLISEVILVASFWWGAFYLLRTRLPSGFELFEERDRVAGLTANSSSGRPRGVHGG